MSNITPSISDFLVLDSKGNEYPSDFSHQEAVQLVSTSGFLRALQDQFGEEHLNIEQWPSIQDAYFHTEIVLKHLHPLFPEDRYSLKLSNFGNLAQISAIDINELPQEAIDLLSQICTSSGYILLPDELLYTKWESTKGILITAAKRFFSYV